MFMYCTGGTRVSVMFMYGGTRVSAMLMYWWDEGLRHVHWWDDEVVGPRGTAGRMADLLLRNGLRRRDVLPMMCYGFRAL